MLLCFLSTQVLIQYHNYEIIIMTQKIKLFSLSAELRDRLNISQKISKQNLFFFSHSFVRENEK